MEGSEDEGEDDDDLLEDGMEMKGKERRLN